MIERTLLVAAAVAALSIVPFGVLQACASEPLIQQIHINSTFNADNLLDPGPPPLSIETINFNGHGYVSEGRAVTPKLVHDLVTALRSHRIDGPSLADWGVTQTWLDKRATQAFVETFQSQVKTALPAQRELFFNTFRNMSFAQQALPRLSAWSYTSDNRPSVRIVITMTNGDHIWAEANSQSPFMVPWTIEHADQKYQTWNVAISRAVAAIVPKAFLNAGWLRGDTLLPRLAAEVEASVSNQWAMIGAEAKVPRLFASLRANYIVDDAQVSTSYNEDFMSSTEFQRHPRAFLWATLSRTSDPPNFKIYFVAPNGGRNALAPPPALVNRYVERVLSIPWLARIIAARPEWKIGIRIYRGRSFNPPGVVQFKDDMQAAGRPDLARQVTEAGKNVVLVISAGAGGLYCPIAPPSFGAPSTSTSKIGWDFRQLSSRNTNATRSPTTARQSRSRQMEKSCNCPRRRVAQIDQGCL